MGSHNYNPALPLYENAIRDPTRTALWTEGVSYTYRELAERSARIAAWLRLNVGKDLKRVAIFCGRGIAAYEGILGTGWAGACYVPLNTAFPEQRLLKIIKRAKPEALVIDRETLPLLTHELLDLFQKGRILLADGDSTSVNSVEIPGFNHLPATNKTLPPDQVNANDEAYLVFTSGTTGEPSGVAISAGSLNFAIRVINEKYPFRPEDRFSQFFDLSFDFSIMDLFVPWLVGASTYVIPLAQKMGPARFIIDHQLTVWTCVPSMISIMDRMKMLSPGIFPSLRFSCFSGETLTTAAASTWQEACPNSLVVNLYGQTEAPIGSLVQPFSADTPQTKETGGVALGQVLSGTYVDIINEDGSFAETDIAGELALTGPHLAKGYLDDPGKTADRFRNLDHPEYGHHTWYITGDLGQKDSDNIFHFLGRADNEIKISGHRFMLEEVEFHLRKASNCRMAAVIPLRSELGIIEALAGFVSGDPPPEREMKNELMKILPRPMVPRRITTIEEMPLSQNGKVDRRTLADMYTKVQNT